AAHSFVVLRARRRAPARASHRIRSVGSDLAAEVAYRGAVAAGGLSGDNRVRSIAMSLDTAPHIAAIHNRLYQELGVTGRARIAAELSDMLRALAAAGVRQRNPNYDDEQVHAEVLAVFYGRKPNRR